MLIIWLLSLQFSVTVGHSPSLGRSIFLAAQQQRDMFANKADTVSPRLPASREGRREGGDSVVCPKPCLAGTLEAWTVFVCTQPRHLHAFLMTISIFSITQEMKTPRVVPRALLLSLSCSKQGVIWHCPHCHLRSGHDEGTSMSENIASHALIKLCHFKSDFLPFYCFDNKVMPWRRHMLPWAGKCVKQVCSILPVEWAISGILLSHVY